MNDTAIKNLTQNFPYQLNHLYLDNNQIGNEGALALAEILPCTNLTYIYFSNNSVNDTTIVLAAQQKALQKVCDDQRCHANLPASQSCNVPQASSEFSMMAWGRESSIEVTNENSVADMKSSTASYSYGFFDFSFIHQFQSSIFTQPGFFDQRFFNHRGSDSGGSDRIWPALQKCYNGEKCYQCRLPIITAVSLRNQR